MGNMQGRQLYGFKRLKAQLKMSRHPELKGLTLKQKLALNYVAKEQKLTELEGKVFSNTFTPFFPSAAYDRFLKSVKVTSMGEASPVITNFAVTS